MESKEEKTGNAAASEPVPEQPPVVTEQHVRVGDRELTYFTTVGMLPIRNDKGEVEARLFYTAYTLDSPEGDRSRPLMFSFNGGPGSSSVWLHLGGLGPRRVRMLDDGAMPPPPFELVENEFTWLEQTDLVFIDPVDTGYSRAESEELTKKYLEVKKDLESVGEFIRLYLSRSQRWASPLFLVGESYGTFRAAGLAGLLIEKGIAFNGIVLVSSVLNLLSLQFHDGNDLPYLLFLPTYAASAWYHKRLAPGYQAMELPAFLAEVEAWTAGEYAAALVRGHVLPAEERARVVGQLAAYTGLDPRYIDRANLRIEIQRFCRELLREEGRTVGRLDSRYTAHAGNGIDATPDHDPSLAAIRPPFTSMLNDYVRSELGYESDREYHILRGLEWSWGNAGQGYARTTEAMAAAFAKNPYLHVFVASGYYDLATPYFATDYTFDHLPLEASVRQQVRTERYPVGHMVYLERGTLEKLQRDVAGFIAAALNAPPRPLPNG